MQNCYVACTPAHKVKDGFRASMRQLTNVEVAVPVIKDQITEKQAADASALHTV